MIFSVYEKNTGRIVRRLKVSSRKEAERSLLDGQAFVEGSGDFERHHVVNGEILDLPDDTVESEIEVKSWRTLRIERDQELRSTVDTINAVRWDAMSSDERKKWKDYRQALLDLPETTVDPTKPVWPQKPE